MKANPLISSSSLSLSLSLPLRVHARYVYMYLFWVRCGCTTTPNKQIIKIKKAETNFFFLLQCHVEPPQKEQTHHEEWKDWKEDNRFHFVNRTASMFDDLNCNINLLPESDNYTQEDESQDKNNDATPEGPLCTNRINILKIDTVII